MEEKQTTTAEEQELFETQNAKEKARQELETDIERFLASGGHIQQIDINVMADPPTKPITSYGGKPI